MKRKLFLLPLLCCIFITFSFSTVTHAAVGDLKVSSLKSKEVFKALRTKIGSTTTTVNYKYNTDSKRRLPYTYIYSQAAVDRYVGSAKFADMGCELAACFNATLMLDDPIAVREGRRQNVLANYIKIAEQKGYLMTFTKEKTSKVVTAIINSYIKNDLEKFALNTLNKLLSIPFTPDGSLVEAIGAFVEYFLKDYTKPGSFGTDPFTIPDILKAGGVAKTTTTYNSYSSMSSALQYLSKTDTEKKIYIVSYWNYDTLLDCFKNESAVHTVCFYTYKGSLYAYNNTSAKNSSTTNCYASLYSLIGSGSNRFIVGYRIGHQ